MEEAVAVRRAASDATADVTPDELREIIDDYVQDGSTVPGVVAYSSARRTGESEPTNLVDRAAGVQLIYDGLRLTRELAQEDPWCRDGDRNAADLAIIAADVLVARGFHMLARTDAAQAAVGVVRAFGRDQTEREVVDTRGAADIDRNLERDVLELALEVGTTATPGSPPVNVSATATEMAPETPGFESAAGFFDRHHEQISSLIIDSGRPLNRND